jgi:hypothetical protein
VQIADALAGLSVLVTAPHVEDAVLDLKKGLKEGDEEEPAPKTTPAPQPAEPTDPPTTQS